MNFLVVGVGGFLGAVVRYSLYLLEKQWSQIAFPSVTLIINVVGSFLAGLALAYSQKNAVSKDFLLFCTVGFLGAFTTFSTFSVDSLQLIRSGNVSAAVAYLVLSLGLSLIAVFVGASF